jgi:predicted metalloprotease with PDZ domain
MKTSGIPSTPIRYDVDLSGVKTNKIKVEMTLNLPSKKPVDIELPVVGPGAPDNNMNYAARLTQLHVTDAKGNAIPYQKLVQGGWRIRRDKAGVEGPVKVSYLIDASEFDFVRAQLNDEHAYMNGSQLFMFVKGHDKDLPAIVSLKNIPNPSWKAISTLRPVKGKKNTFYSPYFQDLADSNIEVGKFQKVKRFVTLNGQTHEITVAQHGEPPFKHLPKQGVSVKQNADDFVKIYTTFMKEFGPFPEHRFVHGPNLPKGVVPLQNRYTIIKHYVKEHHGATGLEHYHGHELQYMQKQEYGIHRIYGDDPRFMENEVMAHELGHKLDAKFVMHKGIDTSDFTRTQPTDGLWYTEGVTDWIAPFILRKAGLITPQQYLNLLQTNINQYHTDYFANPTSATDDSMDAQMGRAGYYNKGGLLGTMLDLEIRHRTGNKKSFADVLRAVKAEFGGTGKYHTLNDVQRITEKVAGGSLKSFFDDYLRNRKPIDFNRYLAYAGYKIEPKTNAWDPAQVQLSGIVLKSDPSGKLTLEANGSGDKEFPLTFLPSLGVFLEKSDDGQLSIYSLRLDGAGYEAGLRGFIGKPLQSLLFKATVPQDEKSGGIKEMEIEVPLNGTSSSTLSDLIKTLQDNGKPLEIKAVGFKREKANNFRAGTKETDVVWVTPKPLAKYVLEELPNVTEEQKAIRKGWLAN